MSGPHPHLLLAISGHGYGHLAQVAPLVVALSLRLPALRLSLRTSLPEALLRERITHPFTLLPGELDFGMRMDSALSVDHAASARDYAALHRDWPARVAAEAGVIRASGADLVVADVPYLSLAAAAEAGIPAIALCSLNWLDIYRHYCGAYAEASAIIADMQAAYRSAASFLCPAPAMPMAELDNTVAIGPIAQPPPARDDSRARLRERLGIAASDTHTRSLLIGMGGVGLDLPLHDWPRFPGWHLIAAPALRAELDSHPDVTPMASLGMRFVELLGGVDALLTKPGYGSYVEAAARALPVLYVSRADWPEEPWLNPWLERHTRATEISQQQLYDGSFQAELDALLQRPATAPVALSGIDQAADHVIAMLAERGAEAGALTSATRRPAAAVD